MAPKFNQIFVNLAVTNVEASTKFYEAIGATKNTMFCDEQTSCMVFSDQINVMIMTHERFAGFCPTSNTIAPNSTTEVLLCLSASSKADIDETVESAGKSGGKMDPTSFPENPGMYGRTFEDLDGHVWELAYMDLEAMKAAWSDTKGEA